MKKKPDEERFASLPERKTNTFCFNLIILSENLEQNFFSPNDHCLLTKSISKNRIRYA